MSSIYKRSGTRFWWVKYRDPEGRIRRKSLRTPHKGVAQEMQKNINLQVKNKVKGNPDNLASIANNYLNTARLIYSTGHYINTKGRLNKYLSGCNITIPADITAPGIQNWCNGMLEAGVKPRTVRGYLMAVSGFCAHLVDSGYISDNPCRRVRLPRIHDMPPRFLTRPEAAQVLRLARKLGILPEVYLALKAGLRSSEIRLLCWEDILFEQNLIYVRKESGKRPRSVPLTPKLWRFLHRRRKSGPVFLGQQGGFVGEKQWQKRFAPLSKMSCFKRCGKTLHALRYTYASWYVQNGGDIYRLSKILGHSSVVTTQKSYAHLAEIPWQ